MRNKIVIITGGSSGIGKALAREFGRRQSKIMITGRDETRLNATVDELQQEGITIHGMVADVSVPESNVLMAEKTREVYGGIDVLINNAGISMRALFEHLDMDVIHRLMNINFFGAVHASQVCLPDIIKRKGSVVGISSIAGVRGLPGRSGYSASKFALNGFLETLRTEMRVHGVHVLTVCPGYTTSRIRERALSKDGSPQGESPRDESSMMSSEVCAQHIYRATVRRKAFLTLTWSGKTIVWLNKWAPLLADRLVLRALDKELRSLK